MVIEKPSPIGIDAIIYKIQMALDKITWSNRTDIYPRCYPIMRDGFKKIEFYAGMNDYLNMGVAEGNKAFFTAEQPIRKVDLKNYSTAIKLFYTVNIEEIKLTSDRADSDIHADVLKAVKKVPNISVDSLVTGIDKVFYGYDYRIDADMQPYHCFLVNIDVLRFEIDQIC